MSDIPAASITKRSVALTGVTNVLGTIDADDLGIPSHNGSAFNALVIYKSTAADSTSKLIMYIDTALGIPFSGSSSTDIPITIVWDNGPNKIISL